MIDAITNYPIGLKNFVDCKSEDEKSGYEMLLELLAVNQQSRAKVSSRVCYLQSIEEYLQSFLGTRNSLLT